MSKKKAAKNRADSASKPFMSLNQIAAIVNGDSKSIFVITLEHCMQGMGDDVVKISSKNTFDTICYYNFERNKIYFQKPVSCTVIEEILIFIKTNFPLYQTVE